MEDLVTETFLVWCKPRMRCHWYSSLATVIFKYSEKARRHGCMSDGNDSKPWYYFPRWSEWCFQEPRIFVLELRKYRRPTRHHHWPNSHRRGRPGSRQSHRREYFAHSNCMVQGKNPRNFSLWCNPPDSMVLNLSPKSMWTTSRHGNSISIFGCGYSVQ